MKELRVKINTQVNHGYWKLPNSYSVFTLHYFAPLDIREVNVGVKTARSKRQVN